MKEIGTGNGFKGNFRDQRSNHGWKKPLRGFNAVALFPYISVISKGRQASNLKESETLKDFQVLMREQKENYQRDLKTGEQ